MAPHVLFGSVQDERVVLGHTTRFVILFFGVVCSLLKLPPRIVMRGCHIMCSIIRRFKEVTYWGCLLIPSGSTPHPTVQFSWSFGNNSFYKNQDFSTQFLVTHLPPPAIKNMRPDPTRRQLIWPGPPRRPLWPDQVCLVGNKVLGIWDLQITLSTTSFLSFGTILFIGKW